MPEGIASFAKRGIAQITDEALRRELEAVYESPKGIDATTTAQRAFDRLTSSKWPVDSLCRFLSGWNSTHLTTLFVSGLTVRMLREATHLAADRSKLLFHATAELAEVIAEDTGIGDTPHNELFVRFANSIVGDDQWKRQQYRINACDRFRNYVKRMRLNADIGESILTTAASENWNSGEYNYFNVRVRPWMIQINALSPKVVDQAVAYISTHSGTTELGHFLHAVDAWKLYCAAMGIFPDPTKAAQILDCYLGRVRDAFLALETTLQ